jgi:hypothetical protein
MSERDKLFLQVLEELPPDLLDVLINIQEDQGVPMAQFIADSIREKLVCLSPEQRGQVLEALRKEGIDLEAPQ